MAYIGNTAEQQAFTPAIDYFSGNGSTTAFTLSRPVASVAQVQATIENVPQNPSDAFTVSGSTITFTSAPPSGTNNIYVYYTSPITQVIQPGQGTVGLTQLTATGNASASTFLRGDNSWQTVSVTPTAVSDQNNTSTGYFDLPTGTTAQRPSSPVFGMVRANTTTGNPEWYDTSTTSWIPFGDTAGSLYSVEYLVVAGGGGGACGQANGNGTGGGGAGGFRTASLNLTSTTAYTVTIGAGGTAGQNNQNGGNGANSVFGSVTSIGGGRGDFDSGSGAASGGSGGGGSNSRAGAAGTAGQGNAGGVGGTGNSSGGGGGAGAVGQTVPSLTQSGAGGAGLTWFDGVTRAGGGGGGGGNGVTQGAGGSGGGTAGGPFQGSSSSATANTGSGSGASGTNGTVTTGNGGSGIVIIRYAGAQRGTGGTVTSTGGYTYHTFTSSGTYTA